MMVGLLTDSESKPLKLMNLETTPLLVEVLTTELAGFELLEFFEPVTLGLVAVICF
jgi:hypothetical protein